MENSVTVDSKGVKEMTGWFSRNKQDAQPQVTIVPKKPRDLTACDIHVYLDVSTSMNRSDSTTGSLTRWEAVEETIGDILMHVGEFDPDGVTLGFFGSDFRVNDNVTYQDALELFFKIGRPNGMTYMAPALKNACDAYHDAKRNRTLKASGIIVIVVTDGEASDKEAVERVIVDHARSLTNEEADSTFGIAFIQVGDDPNAAAYLKHLDDELGRKTGNKDIVDVKSVREVQRMGLKEVIRQALVD